MIINIFVVILVLVGLFFILVGLYSFLGLGKEEGVNTTISDRVDYLFSGLFFGLLFICGASFIYENKVNDQKDIVCNNKINILTKTNLMIESSITKMYQNNYHCNKDNYQADILCQNIMNEIEKNTDKYCAQNNKIIDKLVKTKYNIKD